MQKVLRFIMLAAVAVIALSFPPPASALIEGAAGNAPVQDAGWPTGALAVANLKTRVARWVGPPFGGGEYHFEYKGDTEAFQTALTAFAGIRAPRLELVVHPGQMKSFWLNIGKRKPEENGKEVMVDWNFTVWNPSSWHRLYNSPSTFLAEHPHFRQPVAAPRIDVYLGGQIDWSKVTVPDGIEVIDRRASTAGIETTGVAIRGRVYDMATGKTIAGAKVAVKRNDSKSKKPPPQERIVMTGKEGKFTLDDVEPGMFNLLVDAGGYAPRHVGIHPYYAGEYYEFHVELAKAVSVSGSVTDATGSPIKGARVRLRSVMAMDGLGYLPGAKLEAITNGAGRFALSNVPSGFAQISCRAEGHYHNPIGKLHELPFKDVTLEMVNTGLIHVKVVGKDGLPVVGQFHISLEPEGGNTVGSWGGGANVTDGKFTFKGVPPGRYIAFARPNPSSSKYIPDRKWIDMTPGKEISVELVHHK